MLNHYLPLWLTYMSERWACERERNEHHLSINLQARRGDQCKVWKWLKKFIKQMFNLNVGGKLQYWFLPCCGFFILNLKQETKNFTLPISTQELSS